MKKTLTIIGLAVAALAGAQAQVVYTSGNYTQNFNSLPSSGNTTWTNNTTLTGWFAQTDNSTVSLVTANSGTTTTAGLYSFGNGTSTDRALGYAPTNAFFGNPGNGYVGVRIQNGNAFSLTSFNLSYTGEQWRLENGAVAGTLTVQYKVNATSILDATGWTTISALTFTSPKTTGTTGALNGTASGNFTALSAANISASVSPGDTLFIRWGDANDTGNDQFVAVDDVVFSAIPEPTTWLLIGLGSAFMLWNVRRRRSQRA